MAKITRKSYKRKKTVMGITLFASIALISTGFAAWVVAKNASTDVDGNVQVGTVKDAAIEFTGVKQTADAFVFDCKKDDTTGRVYFQEDVSKEGERLEITITGAIKKPDYLKNLTIQMTVPQAIKDAVEKNYIILPDCVDSVIEIETTYVASASAEQAEEYSVEESTPLKTFTYTIAFKWGTAFNYRNPGEYYDLDETGKKVNDDTVKSTMDDLQKVLTTSEKYNVTLTATANV